MKRFMLAFLAMTLILVMGVSALTLDSAEAAFEAADTQAVLAATAPVPGLNIFTGTTAAADFENSSTYTFYNATMGVAASGGNSGKYLTASKTTNQYMEILTNPSSNYHLYNGHKYEFKFDTHITGFRDSGDLRLNFQQIYTVESGNSNNFFQCNDATWKSNEKAGTWHTHKHDLTITGNSDTGSGATDGARIRLQFRVSNGSSNVNAVVGIDNLSVIPYYNITYKHPNGDKLVYALRDSSGNILSSYEPLMTEGYYIPNNGTKLHIGWSTTENATEAMKSISLANADLTLYPVYADLEENTLVSNKGVLIYNHDFEAGLNAITYIDYDYIDGASLTLNEAGTVAAYSADPTNDKNYAVKLTNSNQATQGDNAQKIYRVNFTDTTEKVGRYTLEYMIMSEGNGTVGDMHNGKLTVGGKQGNYTEPAVQSALSETKGEWVSTLGTITVKEPAENSYTVTVSGCSWVQNAATIDSYLDNFYTGGRGTVEALYIDDVKLYFYPAGSFIMSNGTSDKLVEADGTTYTLPSAKAVFGADIANHYGWKDASGKVYLIGEEVAVSALEFKTLTPVVAEVPENEKTAEMRVTGEAKTTGIRFKASIAPSLKKTADEYGFIVARADVLETLGTELTFDMTAEGIENPAKSLYAKGEAYNKATGRDVVYSENDDGTENYTAVCVGFDTNSKAQVTTKLVTRPYIVFTLSDGSTFTAYGDTYSSSLYDVAASLKNAAQAGNEAAGIAYESASYDGGNHIDDIITVANN